MAQELSSWGSSDSESDLPDEAGWLTLCMTGLQCSTSGAEGQQEHRRPWQDPPADVILHLACMVSQPDTQHLRALSKAAGLQCSAGAQGEQHRRPWQDPPADIVLHLARMVSQPDAQRMRALSKAWLAPINGAIRTLWLPPWALQRTQAYPRLSRLVLDLVQLRDLKTWMGASNGNSSITGYSNYSKVARAGSLVSAAAAGGSGSLANPSGLSLPHLTSLEASDRNWQLARLPGSFTSSLQVLRSLTLTVTDPVHATLPAWVGSSLPALTHLDISCPQQLLQRDQGMYMLGQRSWTDIVAGISSLASLKLANMGAAALDVRALQQLSCLEINAYEGDALPQGLPQAASLQALVIKHTKVGAAMSQQLGSLSQLTQLTLASCTGDDSDAVDPYSSLSTLTALRSLSLVCDDLVGSWGFLHSLRQLTLLDVSRNPMGIVPRELLPCLPSLEVLRMAGVTAGGKHVLPDSISALQCLRMLDVGGTPVQLLPAVLLCEALEEVVMDCGYEAAIGSSRASLNEAAAALSERGVKLRQVPVKHGWGWHAPGGDGGYDAVFGWQNDAEV